MKNRDRALRCVQDEEFANFINTMIEPSDMHLLAILPLNFRNALVKNMDIDEVADFKGFTSPVAGDVDVLIAPNIHAGNIMGKMLACTAGAKMAGFIVGAQVPIVLTSRGSTPLEKYNSIAIAAAAAE